MLTFVKCIFTHGVQDVDDQTWLGEGENISIQNIYGFTEEPSSVEGI